MAAKKVLMFSKPKCFNTKEKSLKLVSVRQEGAETHS